MSDCDCGHCSCSTTDQETPTPLAGVYLGCIIHYVMPDGSHRPAVIVKVWDNDALAMSKGAVNVQIFVDGYRDHARLYDMDSAAGTSYKTSVLFDPEHQPLTWHHIERT